MIKKEKWGKFYVAPGVLHLGKLGVHDKDRFAFDQLFEMRKNFAHLFLCIGKGDKNRSGVGGSQCRRVVYAPRFAKSRNSFEHACTLDVTPQQVVQNMFVQRFAAV